MDLKKLKKLANTYHKALLKKVPRERLENELVKKLEVNVERLELDELKQLVGKSIQLLGEEKVLEILGINPNTLGDDKSDLLEVNSYDEVESFIKASVSDAETLKNGMYLAEELRKWLIELDELPNIGCSDGVLMMSWYGETSYGLAVGITNDTAIVMDVQHNVISNSKEYVIDDLLISDIVDHINIVNYEGKIH